MRRRRVSRLPLITKSRLVITKTRSARRHEAHEDTKCFKYRSSCGLRERRERRGSATGDMQVRRCGQRPNAELDDLEVTRLDRAERRVQHAVVPARVVRAAYIQIR